MNIYIVDSELSEQALFEEHLSQHDLYFLADEEEIPTDAEILSIFINLRVDATFLDAHPRLRFIATRSSTYDHIDLVECARRGVTVSYVPTYGDHTVAEHTFALMLAVARRLRQAMMIGRDQFSYEALRGFQLRRKTLGVIGTGRVGLRVLHLARGFGMPTVAYDIAPRPRFARRMGFKYVDLPELLRTSDIISLHAPLTPETYHMLNAEALAMCRPGVVIINTARGGLIDTEALLAALDSGQVSGVGVDVLEDERLLRGRCERIVGTQIIDRLRGLFDPLEPRAHDPSRVRELASLLHNEQLLGRSNVVFTPHIAFNSAEAIERINRTTAVNIAAYLSGNPIHVIAARGVERPSPLEHPLQSVHAFA